MFTVSQLARSCGLSRSTLLYYESIGLLQASARSSGNYRVYGEADLQRLKQICLFRDAGLKLRDILTILDGKENNASSVLKRRLSELDREIQALRSHQRAILRLLRHQDSFRREEMITKEKWVAIMRASGFKEEDMRRWHVEFERSAPDEHQEFLEFLHLSAEEVRSIREDSRTTA